jgi:hypothetical protein
MQAPVDDGPATSVFEVNSGYAVVQLDSVTPGELSDDDLMRKQAYNRRIANASANTEIMGFVKMLREQSEIEVYEDRF